MAAAKSIDAQFASVKPGDVGIIGDPVEHSLSPAMQGPALKAWWESIGGKEKDAPRYHLIQVKTGEIGRALELVKERRMRGVNVTVPHKEAVIGFLNGLVGFAGVAKSVNTVRNLNGQLLGYNTDADGFLEALEDEFHFHSAGCGVVVLGLGGTGSVLIRKLLEGGARRVFFWNRSVEKSLDAGGDAARVQRLLSVDEVNGRMAETDLVINATSVGLKGEDGLPLEGIKFRKGQFVYDVVYHRETEFLRQAKKAGAKTAGGLGMLLHQGAKAFEIWTGASAPLDLMRKGLKKL